jgi:heat shock protein HtpX
MKRVILLVVTNIAVMLVLSIVLKVLGLDQYLYQSGTSYGGLLAVSAVIGFGVRSSRC